MYGASGYGGVEAPTSLYDWGAGDTGAGIGSYIGGLISPWENPFSSGMSYLEQIPGAMSGYYGPYIKAGKTSLATLMPQYMSLVRNPGRKMNKMGRGFQASPGYGWQVEQATDAANQAASAGGMAGSMQEQEQLAHAITGMANQDYYNYLDHVLGLYGKGLGGLSDINTMGYGASNTMAQSMKDVLESEANMAVAAQAAENQRYGGQGTGWGGLIGSLAGFLF